MRCCIGKKKSLQLVYTFADVHEKRCRNAYYANGRLLSNETSQHIRSLSGFGRTLESDAGVKPIAAMGGSKALAVRLRESGSGEAGAGWSARRGSVLSKDQVKIFIKKALMDIRKQLA